MNRPVVVLLAAAVLLLGVFSAWTVADSASARSASEAGLDELTGRLAGLCGSLEDTAAALDDAAAERSQLRLAVGSLQARLERVDGDAAGATRPLLAATLPDPPAAGVGEPAPDAADAAAAADALREEFLALLAAGVLDEAGTPEEQQRFWELARTTPVLAELIAGLEARVEAAPGDTGSRMQLADAYVAKLLTVPGGPERGLWSEKAEEQWRSVADADPQHWGARFALGENYSYYPAFMGKAGEALSYLSEARALQERRAPEPAHVQTYLLLARMQQQQGDGETARATLQAALSRHPNDASLLAALAAVK
jgi:tetratricopeptide (TPR) repeat protein